ncbi:MAG: MoxR family ATPase [Pirellulaceae bacterium]|jgi:MoxR-like ATPase|nr:MoxR family ATPase [Pirellulaceae bacterium]
MLEQDDLRSAEMLRESCQQITEQVSRVIVGQQDVVRQLLIALFGQGHCLLVGVPGLAKTLMVRTLARALSLQFSRIQFTPDLMPSDITGTEVIQEDRASGQREFRFVSGPVFTNVLLADEINRTPPKTQAALLEAMQECQVTAGGQRHALPDPFFVLATQNPIEQEGTYPLPEAQLDRFMLNVLVDYPDETEELEIIKQTSGGEEAELETVLTTEQILAAARIVREVPIADHVARFALQLIRLTRPGQEESLEIVKECVMWGAGPRAGQNLVQAAKVQALMSGRLSVDVEDIRAVAYPVLRHRIKTNFNAESDGISADDIICQLIEHLLQVTHDEGQGGKIPEVFRSPDAR